MKASILYRQATPRRGMMRIRRLNMNIVLSPRTQKLLEDQMKKGSFSSPDDLLRIALETLDQVKGENYEDLDPQTRAAIEEAEAQCDKGEDRPWESVREELRARFIRK
jgi:Arc/MetJ-type ribon-helix-helix transcriptional regulator